MIRNQDILNCLPLLASALGNRYGVKVKIGGDTPCTNGKVIHIPALPVDCGKTAIALAKGYIDHESAHIRHTDFACFRKTANPLVRHLCNSIEDWRVEKRMAELYPGCRTNLAWLAKHIFLEEKMEEAGNENPAFSILNYVLMRVRAWEVNELEEVADNLKQDLEKVYPGLISEMDKVFGRVQANCPDTQAALDYACELEELIKAYEPPEKEPASREDSTQQAQNSRKDGENGAIHETEEDEIAEAMDNKAETEEHENTKSDNNELNEGNDDENGKEEKEGCEDEKGMMQEESGQGETGYSISTDSQSETEEDQVGPTKEELDSLKNLLNANEDELPKNLGEIIADKLSESSGENNQEGIVVAALREQKTDRLPNEEKQAALRSSNALMQRLAGLLQAHEAKCISPARRGRLNTEKIGRLAVNNPRIFTRETEVNGLSSAVHILLDASYSMENEPMKLARQACYAVARALSSIRGVNPAVTVFPADCQGGVFPLLEHGCKLTDKFMVEARGGTPLAPALWWALQTLYPLPENRKIILIITDGMPDNLTAAKEAIKTLVKLGMEIYGIGINLEAINEMLPGKCRVIRNLAALAPAMFELLQNALLKGDRL